MKRLTAAALGVLLQMSAITALAQSPTDPDPNDVADQGSWDAALASTTTNDGSSSMQWNDFSLSIADGLPKAFNNPAGDPSSTNPEFRICPPGSTNCTGEDTTQEADANIKPQQLYRTWSTEPALLGQLRVSDSNAMGNMLDRMLGSLRVAQRAAYLMTEPAIYGALDGEEKGAMMQVSNIYQSVHALHDQLDAFPELKETRGRAFYGCVFKYLQGKEPSNGNVKTSWPEAVSLCMGDSTDTATLGSQPWLIDPPGSSTMAKLSDNEDWDPDYTDSTHSALSYDGGTHDKNILKLTDAFRLDFSYDPSQTKVKQFIDTFIMYAGNYKFETQIPTAAAGGPAGPDGSTPVHIARELPTVSISQKYIFFTRRYYQALSNLVRDLCVYNTTVLATQGPITAPPVDADPFAVSPQTGNILPTFFATAGGRASMRQVFSPGLGVPSILVQALYNLWRQDHDDAANSTALASYCIPELSANTGEPNSWDTVLASPANKVNQRVRTFIFIAQKLAFARTYSLYAKLEEFANKLTVGAMGGLAHEYIHNLISEATGTDNLWTAINANRADFNKRVADIFKRQDAKIGYGGKAVSDGFAAGTRSNGDRFTTGQTQGG